MNDYELILLEIIKKRGAFSPIILNGMIVYDDENDTPLETIQKIFWQLDKCTTPINIEVLESHIKIEF